MNQANWAKIYTAKADHKVDITKNFLEDQGIQCVVLNKQDSAYAGALGEIELYVQRENVIKAKYLINKNEL